MPKGPEKHGNSKVSKRSRKAMQNEISSIPPLGSGAENNKQYSRRVAQDTYTEKSRKRRKRRRVLAGVAMGLAFVLLAGVAAGAWYYLDIVHNMKGDKKAVANLSTPSKPEDPFYMVLIGQDARPGETQTRSDSLMLAYVNPPKKKVTIVSIPRDTRVPIPGHGTTKINAASAYGGPSLTIQTVKDFAGVDIGHYAQVNFDEFKGIVDSVGGVEVDVPVAIDDPAAGPSKLQPGKQTLDGTQALTFCRSRHFPTGDYQRAKDQQIFLKALAKKVLSIKNPAKLLSVLSSISKAVDTDMSLGDLQTLMKSMKGMDVESIETATVPSAPQTIDGVSYVIADETAWQAMMKRIEAGESPNASDSTDGDASVSNASAPSSVSVTVRNGAGISGVATNAADKLKAKGYNIAGTGNASQFVYDETLVVYKTGGEANAQAVTATLGMGKVVPSNGMYSFDSDILVVVGKDWKPE